MANLRKDGEYYLYKKDTVRSLAGAVQAGKLGTYLHNEWTRMGGMDFSDVGYDAFLINGKRESQLIDAKAGEKVRVRIVNAAASTYFYIALGQEPMQVIGGDGVDARPKRAKEILIGMAKTYDLLFEVPENKNYELRITAQDGTGAASAWIGQGPKVPAPVKEMPDLYASMDHGSMDHSQHKAPAAADETVIETLSIDHLEALKDSSFPKAAPTHDVKPCPGTIPPVADLERNRSAL